MSPTKKESKEIKDPLCQIAGVGPATAKSMREKGIESVAQVATMRLEELKEILGSWGRRQCREAINSAKSLALDVAIKGRTLREAKEYRARNIKYISTGSQALDDILGGGAETMSILGLTGRYGTGKSQLCNQLAVNTKKHLKGAVAWVETESNTFRPERLEEMCKAQAVTLDEDKDFFLIDAEMIPSPHHQHLAYEYIEREWILKQKIPIKLIAIDSFSPKFREFYTEREMLGPRSRETMRHISFLQNLARKHNLAVVLTAQVMGIPDEQKQRVTKMAEGHNFALYGGHVLKHSVTTWVSLVQKSAAQSTWEACVFDAPHLPRQTAEFKIDASGITDVSARRGSA